MQLPLANKIVTIACTTSILAKKAQHYVYVCFRDRITQLLDHTNLSKISRSDSWSMVMSQKPNPILRSMKHPTIPMLDCALPPELSEHVAIAKETADQKSIESSCIS